MTTPQERPPLPEHVVCPTAPEHIWLQVDPDPYQLPVYTTSDVTWCTDQINRSDTLYVRADLADAAPLHAEIERLTAAIKKANEQAEHFERQWYLRSDESEAHAQRIAELEAALLEGARRVEALKRPCSNDPESSIAIQNGRYMGVSHFLRSAAPPAQGGAV